MTHKKNKIGRNAPCPCGSGIKFKKCCMNKYRDARLEQIVQKPTSLLGTTEPMRPLTPVDFRNIEAAGDILERKLRGKL